MPVRALNLQEVGKNTKLGFFSKENTETQWMEEESSYKHSLKI